MSFFEDFVEKISVIVITPHGRAGSWFVQSLFDSEEKILVPPIHINTYALNYNEYNVEESVDLFLTANECLFRAKEILKIDSSKYKHLSMCFFKEHMVNLLRESKVKLSRKSILLSFYYIYGKFLNLDIKKFEYIFLHIHFYSFPDSSLLEEKNHLLLAKDFSKSFYIALVRCPYLSMYSYLKDLSSFDNFLYHLSYINACFLNLQNLQQKCKFTDILIADIAEINRTKGDILHCFLKKHHIATSIQCGRSTFQGIEWFGVSKNHKSTFDTSIESMTVKKIKEKSHGIQNLEVFLFLTKCFLSKSARKYETFLPEKIDFVKILCFIFNRYYALADGFIKRQDTSYPRILKLLHGAYFSFKCFIQDLKKVFNKRCK